MVARKSSLVSSAYGRNWYDDWAKDPAAIDLCLYAGDDLRENTPGALSKWEHFRKFIKALYPGDVFVFNPWTDDMGEAWCHPGSGTIWGSGGTGKSATIGMFAYCDLLANPTGTITVMITNPMDAHKDRAYGNLLSWRKAAPRKWQVGTERQAQPKGLLTLHEGEKRAGVICLSTNPGETSKDLFKKVGKHQLRNRLIVDEPQGCTESVLDLYLNLGATGEYLEMFLGNPMTWFDPLGRHSDPSFPVTRKAIQDEEPTHWETRREIRGFTGTCVVLDGRKSPAFENPDRWGKYLPKKEHVESAIRTRGLDDIWVWNQIIGRIPPGGMVKLMLDQADLEGLGMREEPMWSSPPVPYVGIDFAPEAGDENVLKLVKVGYADGRKVACEIERKNILDPVGADKMDQIAQQCGDQLRMWDVSCQRTAGDASGDGSTLITKIEEYLNESGIYRVQAGGAPSDHKVLMQNPETGKEVYANRATELAFNLAVYIEQGQWMGVDTVTADQMLGRGVNEHPTKHLKALEQKREYRKRFGRSPDEMDASAVVATMLKEKKVLIPGDGSTVRKARNLERREVKERKDVRRKVRRQLAITRKW